MNKLLVVNLLISILFIIGCREREVPTPPCLTVQWSNGDITNVPFREVINTGCGFGSCSGYAFYNNDSDMMRVDKGAYTYYYPCKDNEEIT